MFLLVWVSFALGLFLFLRQDLMLQSGQELPYVAEDDFELLALCPPPSLVLDYETLIMAETLDHWVREGSL